MSKTNTACASTSEVRTSHDLLLCMYDFEDVTDVRLSATCSDEIMLHNYMSGYQENIQLYYFFIVIHICLVRTTF